MPSLKITTREDRKIERQEVKEGDSKIFKDRDQRYSVTVINELVRL